MFTSIAYIARTKHYQMFKTKEKQRGKNTFFGHIYYKSYTCLKEGHRQRCQHQLRCLNLDPGEKDYVEGIAMLTSTTIWDRNDWEGVLYLWHLWSLIHHWYLYQIMKMKVWHVCHCKFAMGCYTWTVRVSVHVCALTKASATKRPTQMDQNWDRGVLGWCGYGDPLNSTPPSCFFALASSTPGRS